MNTTTTFVALWALALSLYALAKTYKLSRSFNKDKGASIQGFLQHDDEMYLLQNRIAFLEQAFREKFATTPPTKPTPGKKVTPATPAKKARSVKKALPKKATKK